MIRPYLRGFIQALVFYPGRVASQHESIALATALPWRGTNEDSPDYDQFISGYAEGMKMIEKQTEGAYVVAPYERRLESMLVDANARAAAYKLAYEQIKYLAVNLLSQPHELQKILNINESLVDRLPDVAGDQSSLPQDVAFLILTED